MVKSSGFKGSEVWGFALRPHKLGSGLLRLEPHSIPTFFALANFNIDLLTFEPLNAEPLNLSIENHFHGGTVNVAAADNDTNAAL
jgi:hypothetical protein